MVLQFIFCGVLLREFIQNSTKHSCVVPLKFFLYAFYLPPCSALMQYYCHSSEKFVAYSTAGQTTKDS